MGHGGTRDGQWGEDVFSISNRRRVHTFQNTFLTRATPERVTNSPSTLSFLPLLSLRFLAMMAVAIVLADVKTQSVGWHNFARPAARVNAAWGLEWNGSSGPDSMKKVQWRERRTDGRTDGRRDGRRAEEGTTREREREREGGGKRRKKPSIWKGSSAAIETEGTRSQSLSQSTDLRYKATIMVPSIPNQCCEKLSLFLDGGPNLSV